ncbi:MAG TPA: hypothetical protein VFR37_21690 [Longimicrobium sp.]|nr:hypothetical protein [Longimicrobium sp.]
MRKLKLAASELVVESFDPVVLRDGQRGTVRAHATEPYWCTIDPELCGEPYTNDPMQRQCVTPYVECSTEGWTCVYC